MKFIFKNTIWLIFLLLLFGNIYIFVSGMKLSDEINRYEKDIKKLKKENIELEKKVYEISSLKYAASVSASLDFTQKSSPLYFENLKYAFNR